MIETLFMFIVKMSRKLTDLKVTDRIIILLIVLRVWGSHPVLPWEWESIGWSFFSPLCISLVTLLCCHSRPQSPWQHYSKPISRSLHKYDATWVGVVQVNKHLFLINTTDQRHSRGFRLQSLITFLIHEKSKTFKINRKVFIFLQFHPNKCFSWKLYNL